MATDKFVSLCTNLGSFLSSNDRVFKKRKLSEFWREGHNKIVEQYVLHWEELNVDIIEKIISDCDVKSIVSVKSVCKSWHSIFTQPGLRTPPKNPWLLLPHSQALTTLKFHDMFSPRNNIYSINVPKSIHGGQVCGSSKGWLVVAKDAQLLLFDPLSGELHDLPPLPSNTFDLNAKDCQTRAAMFIDKIALSSNDLSECVVAAIMNSSSIVACCKPKDNKEWTIFNDPKIVRVYSSMAFCNETLYINVYTMEILEVLKEDAKVAIESVTMKLDGGNDDDDVHKINLKLLPHFTEEPLINIQRYANLRVDENGDDMDYLVESNKKDGTLFLVRKFLDYICVYANGIEEEENEHKYDLDAIFHKTRRFEVFELIPCKDGSETVSSFTVKSVKNLGDQNVMFVGRGSSFAHSFTSIKGGNRIYYTDDDVEGQVVSRETGVFHVGEGKLKHCLPSIDLPQHSYMYWFTPNLPFN